jgi:sRNA-binding carbon storage regulator CsrA
LSDAGKKHAANGAARRPGEEIIVIDTETGEEMVIAVLENRGHQVRIGIGASKRFDIVRREVLERQSRGEAA